jgi:hypothetical protein
MIVEAFGWASYWRKVVYKLEKVNGIECIVSDGRVEVTHYNPLSIEGLSKRPTNPEDNECSPEIALARLDTHNKQEIRNFVNNFGLLGLWYHPKYSQAEVLASIGDKSLMDGTRFSNWYHHPRKRSTYAWMEPLEMFVIAARDYQEFINNVENVEKNDDKDTVLSVYVHSYWREQLKNIQTVPVWDNEKWSLGWEYQSLLSALYLKVAINKQAGKLIRRCRKRRCGKVFVSENPENGFCSETCKSAFFTASSRDNAIKEELLGKYGEVTDAKVLLTYIEKLLEDGISGKRRIEKRILNEFINERPHSN